MLDKQGYMQARAYTRARTHTHTHIYIHKYKMFIVFTQRTRLSVTLNVHCLSCYYNVKKERGCSSYAKNPKVLVSHEMFIHFS
jgi:hypothetical protein